MIEGIEKYYVGGKIPAKGPPKILNSATFGITIYWPKMMFECIPRIQIDVLRPPILIYASKNRI